MVMEKPKRMRMGWGWGWGGDGDGVGMGMVFTGVPATTNILRWGQYGENNAPGP